MFYCMFYFTCDRPLIHAKVLWTLEQLGGIDRNSLVPSRVSLEPLHLRYWHYLSIISYNLYGTGYLAGQTLKE